MVSGESHVGGSGSKRTGWLLIIYVTAERYQAKWDVFNFHCIYGERERVGGGGGGGRFEFVLLPS